MKKGLVVGKFFPPHKAHQLIIETALKETDYVDVLVCQNPKYDSIPAAKRAKWLKELYPKAHIRVIADIEKDDDSKTWAKYTEKILGYTPDVVYSSEQYGEEYSRLMGAKNRVIDRSRTNIPVSARFIRKDVMTYWDYLDPHIRKDFARRICVIGSESTGTTTLSKALARHYKTLWVPEFGRFYTEGKIMAGQPVWDSQEFTFIAKGQQELEDQFAGRSTGLLICDTNAYATKVWHQRYLGRHPNTELDNLAKNCRVDGYIITAPDIPFEDDGMRDGEHIRLAMHKQFVNEIKKMGIPNIVVKGDLAYRLNASTTFIDKITRKKVVI